MKMVILILSIKVHWHGILLWPNVLMFYLRLCVEITFITELQHCLLEVILTLSDSNEWKTSSCRNLNLFLAAQSIWKYGSKPVAEFGDSTMNLSCLWSIVPDLAVSNFHEPIVFACETETCISQSITVKAACSNIEQLKKAYLPVAELFSQFCLKE